MNNLRKLAEWRREIGISDTTAWRWNKYGWIKLVNISGVNYISADTIEQFHQRAFAGEFSKPMNGCASASHKAKASIHP